MSDFYKLTNSTSDFNSRSNDVFDKLANLEKKHDVQAKTHTPIAVPDDDAASSSLQNPVIPNNAIVFKKRPADDTFIRPAEKWQRYDLDDVNEHHLSSTGNQHALNDFFRTRVKPPQPNEPDEEEPIQSTPVFKRPMKRPILSTEDDDDNQFIPIQAPLPSTTTKPKVHNNDDDETIEYKLKSTRKKARGVSSTSEKKPLKSSIEIPKEEEEKDAGDDEEEDINDELFEP